jgi:hypothetical protein
VSPLLFIEISGAFLVGGVAGAGLACAGYRRSTARDPLSVIISTQSASEYLERCRAGAVRRQWDRVLRALPRATE